MNRTYAEWARKITEFEDVTGRTPPEVFGGLPSSTLMPYAVRALAGEAVASHEWVDMGPEHLYCLQGRFVPRHGPAGEPEGFIGFLEDVTEQRVAEDALRASERRFRSMFHRADLPMMLLDEGSEKESGRLEANSAFCDLLGYSHAELSVKRLAQLTHPEDQAHADELHGQLQASSIPGYNLVKRLRVRGGRVLWVRVHVTGLPDNQGRSRQVLKIYEDAGLLPELCSFEEFVAAVDPADREELRDRLEDCRSRANLVGNTFDATRQGGRIVVSAREAWCPMTGSPGLRVTVADSGHGMSSRCAGQLFEPFFSTKDIHGTGLGLWISARGSWRSTEAGSRCARARGRRRGAQASASFCPMAGPRRAA